jgi:hypothetical protein
MNEDKGSVQSLGQALMLSQDQALAASAYKLVAEAKEAICSWQWWVRATLRKIGATQMSPRPAA